MPLDFAVSHLRRCALFMPLHRARNYHKLVGDVYNCCGFNPRPFCATSRGLAVSFTNRMYPLTPIADLNNYIVLYVALRRRKLNIYIESETSIREMFFVNLVFLHYIYVIKRY